MKQRHGASASLPSPLRLFFTVLGIVFIAEAAMMLILPLLLPGAHTLNMYIADASILIVLTAPFLWWFVVRPLRSTAVAEHGRAATIVEHAVDGIITINERGVVESFNQAATRLFGYAAEEVIGKPMTLLLPERYREAYQRGLERVRLTGESRVIGKTIEVHGLRKDGREVPLELSLATWKTGKGTFYTGVVRDITERRRAEAQLHLQRAALESAANAMIITDRLGRITWVNAAFTRLTGYTTDEALGQNPRLLKSGQHDRSFYQKLWETILSGQVWHGEMINKRKDGSLCTEDQTITPVRDERGEISHFIAIKQDVTERKRAEEALRETNDTLEAVIQASPMGITILDSDGNVKLWNAGAERIFGWRREEVLGRPLPSIPFDKSEEHRAFLERVLRGEAFSDTEVVRQKKDGSLIDISLSTAPLRGAKGDVWGAMGIMADISARKRAEEGRARLRAILEATTDFVAIADTHGKPIYINSGGRKMLGIREDEDISNIRIPDTHPEWANRIVLDEGTRSAVRDGVWSGETALLSRDGREIPVSQVILAHKAPDGTVEFLSTIVRDITERKRAEATRQALYRASLQIQEPLALQERLDRLLRAARDVLQVDRLNILLADSAGQWLEAVASLGVEEPLAAIRVPIGPEGGGIAQAYHTQQAVIWDGPGPVPASLRLNPPFDRIKSLRSRVFALVPLVVQGRVIGVLGADRKHSRRPLDSASLELLHLFSSQAAVAIEHGRLYEAQRMASIQLEATVEARTREFQTANLRLEEASRHKSEFLAHMSHELRTPLNSILGFSELLQNPTLGSLNEKQARYADNIHKSGKHLLALINDLLDLSKVEAGKLELQPETFSLPDAIKAAFRIIWPQAEAKQQVLELQVADDLPTIRADVVRFKQILCNLLSNAVKFTPAAGRITVTAQRGARGEGLGARDSSPLDPTPHTLQSDEFVELAVQDTGIGIKAEHLPKLFQPFTQLEDTLTKSAQGTGLGLALTKHLVELHGGQVWAESAGEGQGSTFTIWLPLGPRGETWRGEDAHAEPGSTPRPGLER